MVVDLVDRNPPSTRAHPRRARRARRAFLDAGISGGAAAAEQGTLTLMVGGDAAALARVRPLLERVRGQDRTTWAAAARATSTKVLNNFLNGVTLAATAEVMVAGKQAGLDLARCWRSSTPPPASTSPTLNRFPHIIKGDYLEGGLTGRLMAKDIRLYLEQVARLGVPTFNGPACLAAFEVANALGYGDQITNRVVDGIGDLAGGVRLQDGARR